MGEEDRYCEFLKLKRLIYVKHRAAEGMLERLGVNADVIRPNIGLDEPVSRSIPGTPRRRAPDYVLNPLSVFRMTRDNVPERHAPKGSIPTLADDPTNNGGTEFEEFPLPTDSSMANPIDVDETTDIMDISGMDLDMLFAPNLGWDWQPAETLVGSGMGEDGLLPWVGSSQARDSLQP